MVRSHLWKWDEERVQPAADFNLDLPARNIFYLVGPGCRKTQLSITFRGEKAPAEENDAITVVTFFPLRNPTPGFWFKVKQTSKGGQRWPVVPDVLEQVEGFLKSVGLIVFSDHHVIAAARYHEDDGCHICITKTNLSDIWPTLPNLIIQQPHRHWCPHFITGIYRQITYR